MLEAELFGYRRGAFSGAVAGRLGFVRAADRGTLFLDEIDELSPAGQVALLRVLQERQVVPVGDSQPVPVDLRVCAASQRPLPAEVEVGRFRNDLYARLLGCELRLPPLRERRFDVGHLAGRLVARLAPDRPVALAPAAARALVVYDWPRNVRELERCLAAALMLSGDRPIDLEHLPEPVQLAAVRARVEPATATVTARVESHGASGASDEILPSRLAAKLVEHGGNISAVARDLGKHREQVRRWIQRFGFDVALFRR